MEVTEQTDSRLTLVSSSSAWGLVSAAALLLIGIYLLSGGQVQGAAPAFRYTLGPIAVAAATYILLNQTKSKLTIDKSIGQIVLQTRYLGGLRINKRMGLASLTGIYVRHTLASRSTSASIQFIFRANRRKLTFTSGVLTFDESIGALDQRRRDPRNSKEEALVNVLSGFIGMAFSEPERRPAYSTIMRGVAISLGFLFAVTVTWMYYHLFKH